MYNFCVFKESKDEFLSMTNELNQKLDHDFNEDNKAIKEEKGKEEERDRTDIGYRLILNKFAKLSSK
jgi:hypothetical protein